MCWGPRRFSFRWPSSYGWLKRSDSFDGGCFRLSDPGNTVRIFVWGSGSFRLCPVRESVPQGRWLTSREIDFHKLGSTGKSEGRTPVLSCRRIRVRTARLAGTIGRKRRPAGVVVPRRGVSDGRRFGCRAGCVSLLRCRADAGCVRYRTVPTRISVSFF